MTDYMDLALKYGGFTSLDKVYLKNTLSDLSDSQKLAFITPPPSVINAYFAEIYQKQSPEAATDYYLDLSKELNLFNPAPSFDERKPFIRLNLSGKSYGFCYENADEVALVFAEHLEVPTASILFELAQVFPQYKVYLEGTQIKMAKVDFDEEVLEELAHSHELPRLILEHRGLAKLKSTYTDKLPLMVNSKTKRVHTSYHQAVTATGRLSSRDPNLQNIPVRNEEGRRIRQAFIAREGFKIVAADYSQIELRIMAHLSQDKGLLDAFAQGKDIHRATASEVFGIPLEVVTSEQRRSAKAINFGLIYGMSAFGLSQQIGVERREAQRYMDLYFERYPGVLDYMERTRKQASEQGYVETLDGRRLYLPEINSKNAIRRKASEREAINAPMQGTAADIIKKAMIAVDNWICNECPDDVHMIMQVHDELVFEVRESYLENANIMIHKLMESSMELAIPLKVEVGVGNNWDEAH